MNISFVKMHGLGNDFIFLNSRELNIPQNVFEKFIMKIANRNIGIGCDQVIIYQQLEPGIFDMKIYNSDASIAEACGNASRCIMRLIFEHYNIDNIQLKILNKVLKCQYVSKNDIRVNMGALHIDEQVNIDQKEKLWNIAQKYKLLPKEIIYVDVGNPHIVIYSALDINDQKIIAKEIQQSNIFEQGINIGFPVINNNIIDLNVWERGVNHFTLACGSGACAAFAASYKLGFLENKNTEIRFTLGSLFISYNDKYEIMMSGPATHVCDGNYYVNE